MNKIEELKNYLQQKKGQKLHIEKTISELKKKIRKLKLKKINIEKASVIIQTIAQSTQQELKYRITEPVTLAIESIFEEDPHTLHMDFPIRRDKTECDMFFEQNGNLFHPLKGGAGGMADIASFALRPALLSLHHPKLRRILILDEPFKHLDIKKHELAGEMLQEISTKLRIQIVMTTHSKILSECANKIFIVEKKKLYSTITEIRP